MNKRILIAFSLILVITSITTSAVLFSYFHQSLVKNEESKTIGKSQFLLKIPKIKNFEWSLCYNDGTGRKELRKSSIPDKVAVALKIECYPIPNTKNGFQIDILENFTKGFFSSSSYSMYNKYPSFMLSCKTFDNKEISYTK